MNAQQLKNAILQEAIEGRLVPQDPNDEPASVLLERIRKEKERLVKEGKLKKKDLVEKPISEDEIPFEIPESWEWCRMSSLIQLLSGQDFPPEKYNSENKGVPYITGASNIDNGKLIINRWTETPSVIGKDGDLLIVCKGSGVGKMCISDIPIYHIARQIQIIRCSSSLVLLNYLKVNIDANLSNIVANAQGVIPGISRDHILDLLFPLPPLAEQQRIVAKIEELLPKVEAYGKAQDALNKLNEELPERLKKSILQEAIEGRLVPQDPNDEPASVLLNRIREEKQQLVKEGKLKKKDLIETPITEDEIPFDIPESWEWCRVKTILNVYSARRVHEKDWRSSGIPFYRAREIGKLADMGSVNNDLFIDKSLYEEFSKSGVPLAGDLMVTAVGTLGKTYIVKEGEVFYYKDGSVLCFNNRFHMDAKFLKYYIESPAFIDQYVNESQGTTVATLTMVRVNEYLIPLPPLAEQHRIVEKLEQVLGEIDKLKK